jgi:hypothetical protein
MYWLRAVSECRSSSPPVTFCAIKPLVAKAILNVLKAKFIPAPLQAQRESCTEHQLEPRTRSNSLVLFPPSYGTGGVRPNGQLGALPQLHPDIREDRRISRSFTKPSSLVK